MRNPVKSLFYQYYWWQARFGHQDMPATVAVLFILLNLLFYVDSFASLMQFFVLHSTESTPLAYIIVIMAVFAWLLYFSFLYKEKYKVIVNDVSYATVPQAIGAVLYVVLAFGGFIGSLVLIRHFSN